MSFSVNQLSDRQSFFCDTGLGTEPMRDVSMGHAHRIKNVHARLSRTISTLHRVPRALLLWGVLGALSITFAHAANQVAGRTSGTFTVSPTGASNYAIPIWTPPGPHGLQPHLALVYNSQAGNGYIGVGWSLAGLSAITRCNLTVAQDSSAAPITLTPSDGLCLDGQRLRLTSSGNYGLAGSTYQTEIANFSNVTAYGSEGNGPQYFVVQTRDGLTYTYGENGNSEVQGAPGSTVSAWLVNEIADRAGNTILINYCSSNASSNPNNCPSSSNLAYSNVPASISWAPTTQAGPTYTYSAQFYYQDLNVPAVVGYLAGNQSILQVALTSVVIETNNSPVKQYALAYSPSASTNRDLLTSVTECDGNGDNCLAPTTINYQTGGYGVQNAETLSASATIQTLISSGDFNGDGRTDLAWYAGGSWYVSFANNTGYDTPVNTGITGANALVDNVDGTETSGFLVQQSGYWWYYRYNGSSFIGTNTSVPVTSTQLNSYALVDVDGDGRPDLVTLQSNTALILRLNTSSNGTVSFSQNTTEEPLDFGSTSSVSLFAFHGSAEAPRPSFDGSGRQNVFMLECTVGPGPDYDVSCEELSGLYNSSSGSLDLTFILSGGAVVPIDSADLNEDGCADIWSNTAVIYSACNGSGASTDAFDYPVLGAFDWNGDGLADVLVNYNGYLGVYVSNGTAFTFQGTSIPTAGSAFVIHNATGDGQDALGFYSGSTITYYLHNGPGVSADLMSKVTDGFGNSAAPSYVPIAQNSYQNLSDATYPDANYIGPLYVVSGVTSSDSSSTSSTYNQTYGYFGAWMNLKGRGFEGFNEVSMYDSRNALYAYQYYQRQFPYTGMLAKNILSTGSFSVLSAVITPTVVELSNASNNERFFPSVSTETIQRRELNPGGTDNGVLIDTTDLALTFDNYGNLLTESKTTTDNDPASPYNSQSWITSIQYTPDIDQNEQSDLAQWCLTVNVPTLTTYTASGSITRSIQKSYTTDSPENCRLHSITTAPGTAYAVTETYGYDAFGNIASDTVAGATMPASPASRETQYNWGSAGQFLSSETDPSGATTQWSYTTSQGLTFGVPDTMTDPNHLITQWTYDDFGRKQTEIRPDNTSTGWAWTTCASWCGWSNSAYEVTATQYETNHTTAIRVDTTLYDPVDRVTETEGPTVSGTNAIVQQTYTPLGQLYQKSVPFLAGSTPYLITYTYDALNRLTGVSSQYNASDDTPESTKYVYAGRTTDITDRRGNTTAIVKDVNGWLRETTDPGGYSVTTAYDAAGGKTLVTDSTGSTLWEASTGSESDCYVYGIRAFLTCATDQKLGAWNYTIDSLGEVTQWTDAKGQTFSATYDALSRPLSRTDPEPLVSQWTWGTSANDNAGLLVSECTGSAIGTLGPCTTASSSPIYYESRTYDSDGRLYKRAINLSGNPGNDDGQFLYTYSYDGNTGLLATLQYPTSTSGTALKLQYGYGYGLLQSVTDMTDPVATCGTSCTLWSLTVSENDNSQIVAQETLGNSLVVQHSYDSLTGLLSKSTAGPGGSASVLNQSYAYDAEGNVSQQQDNNQSLNENFFYDAENRLCVVSASPISSCNSSTIGYDGGSPGPGNITSKIDSAGILTSYATTWTSYNYPASITAGAESLTFAYGPDRQRWQQAYTDNSSTETTDYIGGLMEEVSGGGITDYRHYIYAGNEPIAVYSRKSTLANTFNYLLTDQEGSVAAITNSSGATVVNESFTPTGVRRNPSTWSGPPSQDDLNAIAGTTRQGYTFQTSLGLLTGLNDMNGRVQDATIGRFISADPYIPDASTAQDYNRYSYVTNNPLTYVDPSGFDSIISPQICYFAASIPLEGNTTEGGNGSGLLPPINVNNTQLPLFCVPNFNLPTLPISYSLGSGGNVGNGGPGNGPYGGPPAGAPPGPKSPQTKPCTSTTSIPQGGGLSVGGNAEAGIPWVAGASAAGSAGAGMFYNPGSGFSGGGFAGGGATAYGLGSNVGTPTQQSSPGVLGASAGGGLSGFLTNAQSVSQLSGPFTVYSFNLGFGPAQFSAQLAIGGNIWEASLSAGPMGATFGLSGSRITTNTVTSRGNCSP